MAEYTAAVAAPEIVSTPVDGLNCAAKKLTVKYSILQTIIILGDLSQKYFIRDLTKILVTKIFTD